MTSTLDMNSTLSNNLKLFAQRFPTLAEMLCNTPLDNIQTTKAQDGGICYVKKGADNRWHALSNSTNPIQKAQLAVTDLEDRIKNGIAPAVVIGLNPGYTLEILFTYFTENCYEKYIPRRIYVIIDSLECLYGWLKDNDRSDILNQKEIEFYWHKEVKRIVRLCKKDEQRSHLFIPVSTLPEPVSMAIIEPLAQFFISRQEEEENLYLENSEYYKKQSDKELDKIIAGDADRKPRMMIPSHASSTVVQYSVRDTKALFEKEGWEVQLIHMQTDLSRWRINKNITEFKPDIYLQVNHLRTENTDFYPPEMMYITWVQDTVSYINNSENAQEWNEHIAPKKKRRDLIIGYVGQIKEYGYQEDRLSECPMIVNQDIFKARELTAEEKAKYECDICFASNRSKETSLIVKDDLTPKLEKYAFTEDILMAIHDHLWEYYHDEKTCVGYIQLEDKIIELPEVCSLIEKLINKDDHDFVIQRIYWELNDVIYRHVVLEWIDEMDDIKLHLYGRGWETHPRFSKYAKGILSHGEELALAYQSAKKCLHLNSLEADHQRLNEIIDANGKPVTRLSLDGEVLDRQKQVLAVINDLNAPNIYFINTLWDISENILKKFPRYRFHRKVNETFSNRLKNLSIKQNQKSLSFFDKESFLYQSSSCDYINNIPRKNTKLYQHLKNSFLKEKNTSSAEAIPFSVSNFTLKLLEGEENIVLQEYPVLQNNLFCKKIQTSDKIDNKHTYKSLRKKISLNDLIPEYLKYYINWITNFGEKKEIESCIEIAYKKNATLNNLNFNLSIKYQKEKLNCYFFAKKDLTAGRLSIQYAGQLVTLSVNWAKEKEVIKDVFKFASKIQNLENAKPFNLLSIFSQCIKVLGKEKLNELIEIFIKKIPITIVNQVSTAALLENCLEAREEFVKKPNAFDIYILLLKGKVKKANSIFLKESHTSDLLKLCFLAKHRKLETYYLKVSIFLNSNKILLDQRQTIAHVKDKGLINHRQILKFIKHTYSDNLEVFNLYLNYAKYITKDKSDWVHYGLKDLKEGRLDAKGAACIVTHSAKVKNKKSIIKLVVTNFTKLTNLDDTSSKDLISIFSQIIKILGQDALTYFIKNTKSKLNHNSLTLCQEIALLENGFTSHQLKQDINKTDPAVIYFYILKNNQKSARALFNNFEHESLLKELALNAFQRSSSANTFLIYEFLTESNTLLTQQQAFSVISTHKDIQINRVIKFIDSLYKLNDNLHSLYSKLLLEIDDELFKKQYYNYIHKDILNSKITLKFAARLSIRSVRLGIEKKVNNDLCNLIKPLLNLDIVEVIDLYPIYSQMLKLSPKEKVTAFNNLHKKYISKKTLEFTKKLSTIECNFEKNPSYEKKYNKALALLLDSKKNTYDMVADLASNAFYRKRENFAYLTLNYLYRKNVLPRKHFILYISILRDRSLDDTLAVFLETFKKELPAEFEVEFQFTKLLARKAISPNNVCEKSLIHKQRESHYKEFSLAYFSILQCENKNYKKALKYIPKNSTNNILNLYRAIIYLMSAEPKKAHKILKKISENLVSNGSLNYLLIDKCLCLELGKLRTSPKNMIIKHYIMFRLKNPHSPISKFAHTELDLQYE